MILTSQLEEIIEKCRIIKEFAPLPEHILGYYYYDNEYYCILINECIKNSERIYRTVLAEKIGHYRTTIGDITPRKYTCYKDRIVVDKKELIALKWAVDFLIPTDMLLAMVKEKPCLNMSDIADTFFVTENYIIKKFEFMSKLKPIWKIDGSYHLCLYNLLSIYTCSRIF